MGTLRFPCQLDLMSGSLWKTPSSDTAASMTVVPAPGCGTSTGITGMTSGDVGEAETNLASILALGEV